MAGQEKTPGVYIREINAFPNSVVEVETAVPAFIGYTEKAMRGKKSLKDIPQRITSLAEYDQYFGGPPTTQFTFTAPGANGEAFTLASASGRFYLYYGMRLFFDNGGGPCYIVSVGSYADSIDKDAILGEQNGGGLTALYKVEEPTMVVVPDAVLLDLDGWQAVCQQVLHHCGRMQSRVGILDVYDGHKARTFDPDDDVISGGNAGFRNKIASDYLNYGMTYYPWVNTSIVDDGSVDFSNIANLPDLVTALDADADANLPAARATALKEEIAKLGNPPADAKAAQTLHNVLYTASPLYKDVMQELKAAINLQPPSAGVAGVYTRVDNTVGVFKAPANTTINSVVSPAVDINHEEQEDLNVPLDGKAVNAIRTFPGRGLLVWGARTLDGNSQDWRYVNVRRTMIFLEQSIKFAAQAYVFAPNTANTWVTVKSMISNFLVNQWKAGALAGSTPEEAFSVHLGLGETMTPNDILDGYMKVTVKVAIVRPAEFIVITFVQKMQTS